MPAALNNTGGGGLNCRQIKESGLFFEDRRKNCSAAPPPSARVLKEYGVHSKHFFMPLSFASRGSF